MPTEEKNVELKPIPALARTAYTLAKRDFQDAANALAQQTADVMGLSAADGWTVDFDSGVAFREVQAPEEKPDIAPAAAG